ncbi:MAG: DUF4278 domain-containing protein [Leptolyngbyaceae cyanobacterium bins.302]|nr:DUF4278 domain-containing protein [Leptolyngbyaceae cyanobacterium bins.302]
MQLVYRGSTYDSANSTIELSESEIIAKYRGSTYPIKSSIGVTQPQAVAKLTYRGNDYLRIR